MSLKTHILDDPPFPDGSNDLGPQFQTWFDGIQPRMEEVRASVFPQHADHEVLDRSFDYVGGGFLSCTILCSCGSSYLLNRSRF